MNRFQMVHVAADAEKRRKQAYYEQHSARWNNILRFLDYDDLFTPGGRLRTKQSIKRRAARAFKSKWSNDHHSYNYDIEAAITPNFGRDVERDAFMSMLDNALKNYHVSPLTRSQQETVVLDRMAKESNVAATKLISNVLSITVQAAKQRLSRTRAKTYTLDDDFDIIEISKAMQETPRYCPFCFEQSRLTRIPVPTRPMCWVHHERFNIRKDFGKYPVRDFESTVMASHKEYWQAVRDKIDENRRNDNRVIAA